MMGVSFEMTNQNIGQIKIWTSFRQSQSYYNYNNNNSNQGTIKVIFLNPLGTVNVCIMGMEIQESEIVGEGISAVTKW